MKKFVTTFLWFTFVVALMLGGLLGTIWIFEHRSTIGIICVALVMIGWITAEYLQDNNK